MADLAARVAELEAENSQLEHDVAARDAEIAALRGQLASPFRGASAQGGAGAGAAATNPEPAVLSGAILVGMGGQWLRLRPPGGPDAAAARPGLPPTLAAHGLLPLGLGFGQGMGQGIGHGGVPALPHGFCQGLSQGFAPELLGAAGLGGLGWGLGQGYGQGQGQGLGPALPALLYDGPPVHPGWPPPGLGPGEGPEVVADPLQLPAGSLSLSASESLGVGEGEPFDWGTCQGLLPPGQGFWGQRLTHRGSGSDPGGTLPLPARPPDNSGRRGRGNTLGRFGRAGSY